MVTSHYVKRRSAMPEKLQGDAPPSSDNPASGMNAAAGQWRSDAQGQLVYTVTNPDASLVSEAYASSAYVDPSLAGSSPARISRQTSAEGQVTALVGAMRPRSECMSGSGSRSGSERVPWIGALLRGLPRNSTSTPPRARFSLPVRPAPNSLSSLSSPATHAMSTASTRDNALFNSEHTSGSETGDVRFGYEAGEETDGDAVSSARFSARYLSQGSRVRSEMTYGGSSSGESSASSMPATPTKLIIDDQLPSLAHINKSIPSPNGVHKRAPRLPPMPLITLTLDDGLVQRPISLTSDSSSDIEHDQLAVDRAEVLAEAVAASFYRDEIDQFTRESGFTRVDFVSLNRPPSAVTQTRLALRTFGTEDSLTRRMLDGEPPVLQSDDEGEDEQRAGTSGSAQRAASLQKHTSIPTHDSSKATVRRSRELSEEGYGSDSAEGCLEHDDFPTLPAWTPMRRPGQ
ncbi:hypothetical protein CBOM_03774 [Ceraceosorus bombacis]|uniref:Uncharacterized protein n=1 Tax=Ceraceosorus bombacis TaxID=401625 RepID=A0A0P1BHE9_9BASI|nr:hypothetical protein CBOM_03774 [Ceraceosorus bombacis]